jgi:hypothetical protein
MRCADPFQAGLPFACNAERALPDARGQEFRSAEGQSECLEAWSMVGRRSQSSEGSGATSSYLPALTEAH